MTFFHSLAQLLEIVSVKALWRALTEMMWFGFVTSGLLLANSDLKQRYERSMPATKYIQLTTYRSYSLYFCLKCEIYFFFFQSLVENILTLQIFIRSPVKLGKKSYSNFAAFMLSPKPQKLAQLTKWNEKSSITHQKRLKSYHFSQRHKKGLDNYKNHCFISKTLVHIKSSSMACLYCCI